jgi:diaminopimelate epimerase
MPSATSPPLRFTKMHGLGNDFVVIDAIHQRFAPSAEQCRFIADRHFGIGCDQILLVEPAREPDADFHYRIFNADGSEVEQCGNGARCFALFVHEQGLTDKRVIEVGTCAGRIRLFMEAEGQVRVNMGRPGFAPAQIPIRAKRELPLYQLEIDGRELQVAALSMGNPHAVMQVAAVAEAPVARLGPLIESHPFFPERVNAGFMEMLDRSHIRLRVYERGTGETLACGTGACAAVVAGQRQGLLEQRVEVGLPGGDLVIEWAGNDEPVWMTGPASTVFHGEIRL